MTIDTIPGINHWISRYHHMSNDIVRNKAYLQWFLSEDLQNKTVCEVGFGMGPLSLLALQAGPKHIVAFEKQEEVYEFNRWLLKKSGLDQVITLKNEHVSEKTLRETNEFDLMYHELLTNDIWGENVFGLLKAASASIPSVYKTEFNIIPLDSHCESAGFSRSISQRLLYAKHEEYQNLNMNLPVVDRDFAFRSKLTSHLELFNSTTNNLTSKRTAYEIDRAHITEYLQKSTKLASIEVNTATKTVKTKSPTTEQSFDLAQVHDIADITVTIPKKHLYDNYLIVATSSIGHKNNLVGLHECSCWNSGGVAAMVNFVSSNQHTKRDLLIGYKKGTLPWDYTPKEMLDTAPVREALLIPSLDIVEIN